MVVVCVAINGRIKFRDKHGTGLAETSIYRVHNLLHQALGAAVHERLIPSNPVDGVTTPKKHYKPKQILNDEQLDKLMDAIKDDEVWCDFFYTELTTGLRRGEICALRWEDFDENGGKLLVRRSVIKTGGEFVVSDPKAYAGQRTIYSPRLDA